MRSTNSRSARSEVVVNGSASEMWRQVGVLIDSASARLSYQVLSGRELAGSSTVSSAVRTNRASFPRV